MTWAKPVAGRLAHGVVNSPPSWPGLTRPSMPCPVPPNPTNVMRIKSFRHGYPDQVRAWRRSGDTAPILPRSRGRRTAEGDGGDRTRLCHPEVRSVSEASKDAPSLSPGLAWSQGCPCTRVIMRPSSVLNRVARPSHHVRATELLETGHEQLSRRAIFDHCRTRADPV